MMSDLRDRRSGAYDRGIDKKTRHSMRTPRKSTPAPRRPVLAEGIKRRPKGPLGPRQGRRGGNK